MKMVRIFCAFIIIIIVIIIRYWFGELIIPLSFHIVTKFNSYLATAMLSVVFSLTSKENSVMQKYTNHKYKILPPPSLEFKSTDNPINTWKIFASCAMAWPFCYAWELQWLLLFLLDQLRQWTKFTMMSHPQWC